MRRKAVVLLAASFVSIVSNVPAASAALSGFGDVVVDAAHEQVFVSSGPSGSAVTVYDFDGRVKETITGAPGASAMVLEGSRLYVLLTNNPAVHVIDTATLTKTETFTVPLANPRTDMAMAGGKLWFGTGECEQWNGKLTSLDPATGTVATYDGPTNGDFFCTDVAAAPNDPDTLVAYDLALSPPTLYKYDVTTGAVEIARRRLESSAEPKDVAFSADGSTLLVAAGFPYEIQALGAGDFAKIGSYPTGPYPVAVAVSPDGDSVAAGVDSATGPDVVVFDRAGAARTMEVDFEGASRVLPGGLAFAPDGGRVFAVTGPASSPVLRISEMDLAPTSIALSVSHAKVPYRGSVTVTADLRAPGGLAGQRVAIFQTPYGGTKTLVKKATVDSDGVVRAKVELTSKTTFVAEYAGDAERAPSKSRGQTVKVGSVATSSMHGYFGTQGKFKLFHYGDQPVQRGKVTPNHGGATVQFVLQINESGRWRTIDTASVPLDADSSANAVVIGGGSPHDYRSRVVFEGDADHLGDKSKWSLFRYE